MNASTEELYEQAKRVIRGDHPDYGSFILACTHCGASWPEDAEVGMVSTHFEISHDWVEGESPILLDLVFIGEGPPPEPRS